MTMSKTRANFMARFLRDHPANVGAAGRDASGRVIEINRQDLLAYMDTFAPGEVGPCGKTLRYPSWLTNGDAYRTDSNRGVYTLPWDEYDAWVAANGDPLAVATATPAPAAV